MCLDSCDGLQSSPGREPDSRIEGHQTRQRTRSGEIRGAERRLQGPQGQVQGVRDPACRCRHRLSAAPDSGRDARHAAEPAQGDEGLRQVPRSPEGGRFRPLRHGLSATCDPEFADVRTAGDDKRPDRSEVQDGEQGDEGLLPSHVRQPARPHRTCPARQGAPGGKPDRLPSCRPARAGHGEGTTRGR